MQKVMGIIDDTREDYLFGDLTGHRSLASLPFGSRYRLIDFILSNMVNSGIKNIGILVDNKQRSLMDHLGPGKEWDLDRKKDGLFILLPDQNEDLNKTKKGNVKVFQNNIDYLEKSRQEYVIIASSHIISNFNLQEALQYHMEKNADITLIYHPNPENNDYKCTFIKTNSKERVIDIRVNPRRRKYDKVSMDIFILKKNLLLDLMDSCISRGQLDLVKDGFIKNLDQLKIYGYPHKGYVSIINSVRNYFQANMNLLNSEIWEELFLNSGIIYTKVKDEPPSKYSDSSLVRNVLLANGCSIEGRVENSILFRAVRVHNNATVKNSIIMQKSEIGEGAMVENAILDKNVVVKPGKRLVGDSNYPLIVKKKSLI